MDGEPVWVTVSASWRESGILGGWCLVSYHITDDQVRVYLYNTRSGASFFPATGLRYILVGLPPQAGGIVMLIITVQVNAPAGQAIGIKEDLAMYLERWGDARVVSVEQRPQPQMEQMTIGGKGYAERDMSRMRR